MKGLKMISIDSMIMSVILTIGGVGILYYNEE